MNKLTKLIIFVLVGVVLAVAVMAPIMEDMSERVVTSHNQSDTRYKMTSFFQEETIENINGEPYVSGVKLTEFSSESTARVITEDFIVQSQYNAETGNGSWQLLNIAGDITTNFSKIVFKKGIYTIYNGETEVYSGDYDFALIPSKNGDYVAGKVGSTLYCNAESEIYVAGIGSMGNTLYMGSVKDGFEVVSTGSDTTPTITVTSNLIQESSGLYEITGYTIPETYKIMYVPIEYYEITTQDEAIRSIIQLLPLLAVLMILIAAGYGAMSYIKGGNRGGDI